MGGRKTSSSYKYNGTYFFLSYRETRHTGMGIDDRRFHDLRMDTHAIRFHETKQYTEITTIVDGQGAKQGLDDCMENVGTTKRDPALDRKPGARART